MPFIRYKTIGGKEYAYEITSYWDREKQKPRQKSRYLGVVVDKEKGIFVNPYKSNVEEEKLILDFGDTFFLSKFMEKHMNELYTYISHNGLLPLVLFRLTTRSGLNHARIWHDGNVARFMTPGDLSSQRISELLTDAGDERKIREFFSIYLKARAEGIAIDTAALPNQIDLDLTPWGYSSDSTDKKLKLVLVIDRAKREPLYFRYVPSGIVDMSTLTTTINEMKGIGIDARMTILDAGFFSEDNIKALSKEGINFLIRVPVNRSIYHEVMKSAGSVEKPENAVVYGERALFIVHKEAVLAGNTVHLYLVLDPKRRGRELRKYIVKHPRDAKGPAMERMGYMVLMSSIPINRDKLILLYYTRQFAKKAFSYSKDDLAMLRVHSEETLRGYLFLIFLSLMVYMKLQNTIGSLSLDVLRNLKCKVFKNEIVIQEPTKDQKQLFDKVKVIVPKVMEI
ncbi:MAG: transposase [Nitrososphaerota archaeon]|jgi:hypothetical protein|nr:transposase [Nitrososphaerota archaeon]MDG6933027.1 transposase [Nitrososphaerota archaeon]MDG6935531.1 transposase [Nitrososphaerota archaeon]MDG6944247.1 transposase [Nitrososphaerota archaeon]